ncbi:tumor necrosis factor receptor superfamily member 5 isoform X2 [Pelobates cultripes]|uniref:Tumor necrosis factor receptor superfamily member 5 n=1 Tax=Pelobates cultripes TaxID=61616 RepID=A0AAD1SP60_PELCU|nr:tumor necrosis factor receptor superfamily member 5 isoform X2 [Pelobates cultripes]
MKLLQFLILVLLGCNYKVVANTCSEKQYSKDGRCCDQCPPGHKVGKDCDEQNTTICLPCDVGEFQNKWNSEASCHQHNYCDNNAGLELESEGTNVKDVQCRCQNGRHCSSQSCETCIQNKACDLGEGVIQKAYKHFDTQCSPCPHGKFSNVKSDTEECQSWTSCNSTHIEDGPGSNVSDVKCKSKPQNGAAIYIPLVLFLLFVVLAIFVYLWYRRKNKNTNHREVEKQNDAEDGKPLTEIPQKNIPEEVLDLDQLVDTTIQGLPVAQEQGKDCHMSQEEKRQPQQACYA